MPFSSRLTRGLKVHKVFRFSFYIFWICRNADRLTSFSHKTQTIDIYKYNPFHTAPISKVVILISPLMSVASYGSTATALDVGLRGKIRHALECTEM